MTRLKFYATTAIIIVVSMVVSYFFDATEEDYTRSVKWTIATISAYLVWHDYNVLPISLDRFIKSRLPNPPADLPPSGGQVQHFVGSISNTEQ